MTGYDCIKRRALGRCLPGKGICGKYKIRNVNEKRVLRICRSLDIKSTKKTSGTLTGHRKRKYFMIFPCPLDGEQFSNSDYRKIYFRMNSSARTYIRGVTFFALPETTFSTT